MKDFSENILWKIYRFLQNINPQVVQFPQMSDEAGLTFRHLVYISDHHVCCTIPPTTTQFQPRLVEFLPRLVYFHHVWPSFRHTWHSFRHARYSFHQIWQSVCHAWNSFCHTSSTLGTQHLVYVISESGCTPQFQNRITLASCETR